MYKKLVLISLFLLSGCSGIGKSEFNCSGVPDGTVCKSARDVYFGNYQRGGETDIDSEEYARDPNGRKKKKNRNNKTRDSRNDFVIDTYIRPNLPDKPVPVRTPAKVMKIWIAPWEDRDSGAFFQPGFVYTEVEPRRWVPGMPSGASTGGRVFQPLNNKP